MNESETPTEVSDLDGLRSFAEMTGSRWAAWAATRIESLEATIEAKSEDQYRAATLLAEAQEENERLREGLEAARPALEFVSRGWGHAFTKPYPDASARRALGLLQQPPEQP